jgi:cytochrome d ubiquinol oxidase subunit I
MFPFDALPLAESSNLLAARNQMAWTLGFHIVFSCIGVALPATMLVANYIGLKKGDEAAMELARRWSKAIAVTFAVGAVSGTLLSFEFGLLWPEFMDRFGAAFGVAFAIEGIFFFLEAIFITVYIYGWKRLRPWPHFFSGLPIVLTGIGGALSVVAANAWMNQPQGFTLDAAGKVVDVEPLKVLFNPATGYESAHMILAAYMVVGFLVASIYAVGMLKGRRDRVHRLGLLIPLTIACIATPIQLFVGDTAAREIASDQPAKFAAMECIETTGTHQEEYVGGVCTEDGPKWGVGIPDLNSFLVGWSADTKVIGLDQIPDDEEPPANTLLHLSFDTMVGIGSGLFGLAIWFALSWWRRRDFPQTPWFLRIVSVTGVASTVALWCGWIVTEVGRQPWIVNGYMRTSEAVTQADGIWFTFALVMAIYAALTAITIGVLRAMSRRWREGGGAEPDADVPYGPRSEQDERAEAGA